jgi:GNAT superfamily N-acetyltransferase
MIRCMTMADLGTVLNWAAEEGWNPGLDDAAAFLATDPEGFFVAIRDGAPVAAISVVNHAPDFAFLGLYLCRPEWRGKGIAFDLWTHALTHAGARTIGLDGVAAQQANYARSGFQTAGATLVLRGNLPLAPSTARVAEPEDLSELVALDFRANGQHRTGFMTTWVTARPSRRTVVLGDRGSITGFATARLCRSGCKIGPVVAPDASSAMALIQGAAFVLGATDLTLAIPDTNSPLHTRLERLGFGEVFRTARMYRGKAPAVTMAEQAVATLELG